MKKFLILLLLIPLSIFANIGKISALKGEIKITNNSKTIMASKGQIIHNKDIIKTSKKSRAQLVFIDGTIMTIGQNTTFKVDDYSYGKKKKKAHFSVPKGIFKSITGKIGKLGASRFKLKAKSASIGIRGTIFLGEVTDDLVSIACTEGAIDVTSFNKTVAVDAGEMTTIKLNKPPSPPSPIDTKFLKKVNQTDAQKIEEATKKIEDISIKSGFAVDKDEIKEVVDTIVSIQDANDRRELEDLLNDKLYDVFQKKLNDNFKKVTVPSSYNTGYTATASYEGIDWGFFALDNVVWDKDNESQDDFKSKLSEAIAIQMWIDSPAYTPQSKIAQYIGYDDTTGYFAPHWDGTSSSRTIGEYSGKVIAITDYNTVPHTDGVPHDSSLLSFTDSVGTNETYLKVDYGNKSWNEYISFDIVDPKNGGTDSWYVWVAGIGEAHVTKTGLKEVTYWNKNGYETLTNAEFVHRYFGANTEQIAGTFNFFNTNGSATYGNIVYNQTALTTLTAQELSSNSNFSWGYWSEHDLGNKSEADILASNPYGGWIKPINGLTQTGAAQMDTLINTAKETLANVGFVENISYSGSIVGTVQNNITNTAELMKNGSIGLDFNFGTQTYSGNMQFDAGSEDWRMDISNGTLDSGGFFAGGVNTFSSTTGHDAGDPDDANQIKYGEMNGKFYGENAASIGGGFEIINNQNKTAIGAFTGTKAP